MSSLWIVHRDVRERSALTRLAAAGDAVCAAPSDAALDAEAPAGVVVLGLMGLDRDWELELEFAHRQGARLGAARWILLGGADERDAALALFDRVAAEFLPYPPSAERLRQRIRAGTEPARAPLSQRARRRAVAARFSLWLADLEIPELLRTMDPRLAEVPLRVRGEPGTGRAALVRYVHEFGTTVDGALLHLPCTPDTRVAELAEALERVQAGRSLPALCIWLDEVGRLAPAVQRELREWIEAGPPSGSGAGLRAARVRWMASHDETGPELTPELAHALAKLDIRLPPLRERLHRLETLVEETARAWAQARREKARRFDAAALEALAEYPWPGNLRELESAVERTLATTGADPVREDDLALEGLAPAPLDAASFGTLLPDEEERADEEPGRRAAAAGAPVAAPVEPLRRADPPSAPLTPLPGSAAEPAAPGRLPDDAAVERFASALSHEMRDPLYEIRSLAQRLAERGDDAELHQWAERVRDDARRIEDVLGRLDDLAKLDAPAPQKVDVPALLEALLDERREAFHRRHLLVLKELDSSRPLAQADPHHLRLAFEALLDAALDGVPERGDVYLASRHHDGGASAGPSLRVLLRFHEPQAREATGPPRVGERSLALLVAELLVRAQGGRFTMAASEAEERVIVIDLPAP